MRNIIFTSLLVLIPAWAVADGPDPGCYERSYSGDHLAAHPAQVVSKMRLLIFEDTNYNQTMAAMEVQMTVQGHVAGTGAAGRTLRQGLICFSGAQTAGCAVECDGGSFTVRRQDKQGIVVSTDYLTVGQTESCGGLVDLAEVPGEAVSYLLNAAPMSVCSGLR